MTGSSSASWNALKPGSSSRLRSRTLLLLCTAAAIVLAGCGASLYLPGPADATPSAPLEELTAGRELYTHNCNSCHSLFLPDRFTPDAWQHNLDRMQPRARITDAEKALILKYLLAGRGRH